MGKFRLKAPFKPNGDQLRAIEKLTEGIKNGMRFQTLLGVTGSGKTFTMAGVIERVGRPAIVVSHNKTLAAQLYREFSEFFPDNAVEYFVSYYDYYQPEAYLPATDTFIEKDFSINDEIDRMRLAATSSLMEREDVIVVATVSCIYGVGNPRNYRRMRLDCRVGQNYDRDFILRKLLEIHYSRNDFEFTRSTFRVRGDVIEIMPSYSKNAVRLELFGDELEKIYIFDPLTGQILEEREGIIIYPASHYVVEQGDMQSALIKIEEELEQRYNYFISRGKLLEAQRIKTRTLYDLEMMRELGYCNGIENYSRHIFGREEGERPAVLLDYFPEDYIMFIDESHVTVPQIGGMYEGDRSRKLTLVEHGFRLPSALDNRPLYFEEFENMINKVIFVSATPAEYERRRSAQVVEQIIRPTGLLDPEIEVRDSTHQIDDLIEEIKKRVSQKERVLVTTLTKRMAEDLASYLSKIGLRVRYLHSEIQTIERTDILRDLRAGEFDVLVGINLLREGLDLPEVSLVAILDADKVGFLRSATSLIQTAGRAARNVNGKVLMYAERVSDAMLEAINETNRRRKIQEQYNREHGIIPESIKKQVVDILRRKQKEKEDISQRDLAMIQERFNLLNPVERKRYIKVLEQQMLEAARNLEFERAIIFRDEIERVRVELTK
ncbi:MAG: excinuclease ABC subunit UvrB [Spirochaetota bacterium]